MKLPTFSAEKSLGRWQTSYTGKYRLITGGADIQMMDAFSDCVGENVKPTLLSKTTDDILKVCGHDLQCWKNALESWGSQEDLPFNRKAIDDCYTISTFIV